ncbi:MAG: hypothetical protein PHX18_00895 [Candidatus Gastranaerophilales bacterium]|nr:hypothetical protein [Candidatus Gastranaerophilales bacterium]
MPDNKVASIQGNIQSKNILMEANIDTAKAADFHMAANLEANSVLENEDGSIYLLASNKNSAENASANFIIDGKMSGNSATAEIKADNITLNSEINVSGVGKNGGTINIEGKNNFVSKDAKIIADSDTKDGGLIKLTAPYTKIYGTQISASGGDNGGTIYLGGADKTADILAASIVTGIDPDSTVRANGILGEGGKIFLNSKGTTYAYGKYETLGKGFIEVSSEDSIIDISKDINTGGGSLLIDPKNVIIVDGGTDNNPYDYEFAVKPGETLSIDPITFATWSTFFSGITIQANNDITVKSSWANINPDEAYSTLVLAAGRSIFIEDGVSISDYKNIYLYANFNQYVVPEHREPGLAEIIMGSGSSLSVTNDIILGITEGMNLADRSNGNIVIENITCGGYFDAKNEGPSSNADIIINGNITSGISSTFKTNDGDIIQSANSQINTKNLLFSAGENNPFGCDVQATSQNNTSTGLFYITKAKNADVYIKDFLTINLAEILGDLTLSSDGAITSVYDNFGMSVAGTTTFNAGSVSDPKNINFTTNDVELKGPVIVNCANNVNIINKVDTLLGNMNVYGNLNITVDGDITQVAGEKIVAEGTSEFISRTSKNIILNNSDNDFIGAVKATGNNITIYDINSLNVDSIASSSNVELVANNNNSPGIPAELIANNVDAAGDVLIKLLNRSNAGNMTLNDITGNTIQALNESLIPDTDVILNGPITSTSQTTSNPLIISSAGGNVINNYGPSALDVESGQRWLIYTGSPEDTTLGGLTPEKTYFDSTIVSKLPTDVTPYKNSVLYRTPEPVPPVPPSPPTPIVPPTPDGGGSNNTGGIVAGSVVGGTAAGGVSIAAFAPIFLAGLNPSSIIAAKPLYLATNQEPSTDPLVTGAAAPIKTTGNSNFYYDKEKNRIIWVETQGTSTIVQ